MNSTQILIKEHDAIKLMLKILAKLCDKSQAGERIDPEHLQKILEFIRVFADQCHHGKEENLLFPALQKVGLAKNNGPIAVMTAEHDLGRKCVQGLSEGIDKYIKGDSAAINLIIKNSRNYIELLTQHIDKEDNILYPMADAYLSPDRQDQLAKDFAKVEEEKIGSGRHEKFHQLLNDLKKIYL